MSKSFVLKGNICYMTELHQMEIWEQSYVVCEDGECMGVFKQLPRQYQQYQLIDCQEQIIIPGLVDLHIHAPQYSFSGLNMDLELLEWLNTNTFPEEAKYSDLSYAREAYTIFVEALKNGATTRSCIFSTIHTEATKLLMDMVEKSGLKVFIGKVNMDRNSPEYLIENSAKESAEATINWLKTAIGEYENVKPILTPRFIPSCSDELMNRLRDIQKEYHLPVQSHLAENPGEVQWVRELCPDSAFYGDAYDRFGLFGGGANTIMAHCVYCGEEEQDRMRERGVFVAHCPGSNMNLSSGIAPVREFLEKGIRVGLGSDVAGGFTDSIFRTMVEAVQASKLRWRLVDDRQPPLTIDEVFYLATKGGGEFFGKVGSFEKGYEFDALVLNDENLKSAMQLTTRERLERLIYLSDNGQIRMKFVAGKQIL